MHYESYTVYDHNNCVIVRDVRLQSAAVAVVEAAGWILDLTEDDVSLHDPSMPGTQTSRTFLCFGGDAEDRLRRNLQNALSEACKRVGGRYVARIDDSSLASVDRAEYHSWETLVALREVYEDHILASGYPRTQAAENVAGIIAALDDLRPLIKAARKEAVEVP